jgi:isopentenyl diphosphate isomerase/L-lactate dehydrogenase-like FMN-dependent dehydrogenase
MPVDPERIFSVDEARRFARRRLPRVVFDYVDGAAGDEVTVAANRAAFEELSLRPALPERVAEPSIATTVLGHPVSLPVLLGPCGLVSMMHPNGAVASARAAAAAGTVSVLSTVAGTPLESVAAQADGPMWFQVYAPNGLEEATALAERAAASGYDGLMVTVDTAVLGKRERDLRHGITLPPKASARLAAHLVPQVLARPGWLLDMVRDVRGGDGGAAGTDASAYRAGLQLPNMAACPLTWDEIAELRRRWHGAFVVKGVITGAEAARAVDAGADAVVVSNHGGRQLDGAPATMRMLPEVLDAVGDRVEVLVDSGVRRGVDVARALAVGARAVLIGRPYLYGVAAAGQAGVERVLSVLATELRHTLTLLGVADVSDLGPEILVRPPQVSSGTP